MVFGLGIMVVSGGVQAQSSHVVDTNILPTNTYTISSNFVNRSVSNHAFDMKGSLNGTSQLAVGLGYTPGQTYLNFKTSVSQSRNLKVVVGVYDYNTRSSVVNPFVSFSSVFGKYKPVVSVLFNNDQHFTELHAGFEYLLSNGVLRFDYQSAPNGLSDYVYAGVGLNANRQKTTRINLGLYVKNTSNVRLYPSIGFMHKM